MILSTLSHAPTFTLPKTPETSSLSLSTHALPSQRGVRLQGGGKGRTHSHVLVLAIHLQAAFVHDSALYAVPFQPGGSSTPIKLISLFHFLCNTVNSSSVTHTNTHSHSSRSRSSRLKATYRNSGLVQSFLWTAHGAAGA